jgi:hypothetical protein
MGVRPWSHRNNEDKTNAPSLICLASTSHVCRPPFSSTIFWTLSLPCMEQQDGIVSIVTKLQVRWCRQELFLFFKMFGPALGLTEFAVKVSTGALPVIKQLGHESNPSSSAEVKNEWSYSSPSTICLYDIHRENFYPFNFYYWKQFVTTRGA